MKKIFLLSVMMIAIGTSVFGQLSATATATATIVTPLSITHVTGTDTELSFGNIIADADGGTVVITPAGAQTLAGLTAPSIAGTISAASFTVMGMVDATYAIGLPASHIISSGGNNMTVNTFTSNPSGTGTLTGGSQVLTVGATLNVGAAQAAGTYTNGTGFAVTVNYN